MGLYPKRIMLCAEVFMLVIDVLDYVEQFVLVIAVLY